MKVINGTRVMALALMLTAAGLAQASDVEHHEGKPSNTVAEAWQNLEAGNAELRELIDGELTPIDMAEVHEISYTLENALARLAEAQETIAFHLEEVHLASERNDTDTVRSDGASYLEAVDALMR